MKKIVIGITGRKGNSLAIESARAAIAMLEAKGVEFEVDSAFIRIGKKSKPLKKFNAGVVLSFGGDGTLLRTARYLKKKAIIAGINFGRTGFLQAFNSRETEKAIGAALYGKIAFEERSRIIAKVDGKKAGEALNEILIVPAKAGRILYCNLKMGKGERREAGDGLIVATPTGSTAHALSAGGPMVKGNANVFVVVSISPTELGHRPLVISDNEKITVSGFECKAEAILDGQARVPIRKKIELSKGSSISLGVKN